MNTNISAGTIARTACLALALTNQILSATGHMPSSPSRTPRWKLWSPPA